MKNLLIFIILIFFTVSIQAHKNNDWNLFPVIINNQITGYIYQAYSAGITYKSPPDKTITSLRLVCSLKSNSSPIIAIYWNGSKNEISNQLVEISINEIPFRFKNQDWLQEGSLIFRKIEESKDLIEAMKDKNTISFTWYNKQGVKRYTIFDLNSFNTLLTDFNTLCRM